MIKWLRDVLGINAYEIAWTSNPTEYIFRAATIFGISAA